MKKRMMAIYALAGALAASPIFTSCVDSDESASVSNIRNAKTEQLKAISSMSEVQAELAKIHAEAEAEMLRAKTALEQEETNAAGEDLDFLKKSFAVEIDKISAEAELRVVEEKLKLKALQEEINHINDEAFSDLCGEYFKIQGKLADMTEEYLDRKESYLTFKLDFDEFHLDTDFRLAEKERKLQFLKQINQFLDSLSFGYDVIELEKNALDAESAYQALLLKEKNELAKQVESASKFHSSLNYIEQNNGGKFKLIYDLSDLNEFISDGNQVQDYIFKVTEFMSKYSDMKFPINNIWFDDPDYNLFKLASEDMVSKDRDFASYDYLVLNESNLETFKKLVEQERELQKVNLGTPADGEEPAKGGLYGELAKQEKQLAEALEADPNAPVDDLNFSITNLKIKIAQLEEDFGKFEANLKYLQENWKEIAPESPLFKNYLAEVDKVIALYDAYYDQSKIVSDLRVQLTEASIRSEYASEVLSIAESNGLYEGLNEIKEDLQEEIEDTVDDIEDLRKDTIEGEIDCLAYEQKLNALKQKMELLQQRADELKKRIDAMMASEKK